MKDVLVKIKSRQVSREAGEDEMEFITEAKLYRRNNTTYLLYEESEFSGIPGCKTRLRLREGDVQMKRANATWDFMIRRLDQSRLRF